MPQREAHRASESPFTLTRSRLGALNMQAGLLWRSIWAVVAYVIAVLTTASYGWSARSSGHCFSDVAWLLTLDALLLGLKLPDLARSPRWARWALQALIVLGLASMARGIRLRWTGVPVSLVLGAGALAAALAAVVSARRRWPRRAVAGEMLFPLQGEGWRVAVGGRRLNHHNRAPAQRGGLDLIRVGPGSRTASRFFTRRNESFAAYGASVLAPCDGTVTLVRDGEPDQIPFRPRQSVAAGNCVIIDDGEQRIVLAHLKPGSVRPAVGDRVRAGEVVGELGNTGNSSEPHLHIHAERDGVGLRLRFRGMKDVWYPGRRIAAASRSRPTDAASTQAR